MTDFHPQAYDVKSLIAEWRRTHHILQAKKRPLNFVVVGAHPDDLETGCGGISAQAHALGHNLDFVYGTCGEAGKIAKGYKYVAPAGKSITEIRMGEGEYACKVLGATAHFAGPIIGQIDGGTVVDTAHSKAFTDFIQSLKPDIVFTHWWDDTHADHRNISQLTREAWEASNRRFKLVCYEVETDRQTRNFEPNLYVKLTRLALDKKHDAIFAHQCQNPNRFFLRHVELEKQRGAESGVSRAEAFHVVQDTSMRQDRHPSVPVWTLGIPQPSCSGLNPFNRN